MARNWPGLCGSTVTKRRASASRIFVAPDLREGDEKALLGREAVDPLSLGGIFGERTLQALRRRCSAAEVGDVFAQRQFAIDMETGQSLVAVVLFDDFLSARLECFRVVALHHSLRLPSPSYLRP